MFILYNHQTKKNNKKNNKNNENFLQNFHIHLNKQTNNQTNKQTNSECVLYTPKCTCGRAHDIRHKHKHTT